MKKIRMAGVCALVLFWIVSLIASHPAANRSVTVPYMMKADVLFAQLDSEMNTAEESGDIEPLRLSIPSIERAFEYPVCVLLLDSGGKVISDSVNLKDSGIYKACLETASQPSDIPTGLIEGTITAETLKYAYAFDCGEKEYTLAAYSRINQITETLRSEAFKFSLLTLTAAFVILTALFLAVTKERKKEG